MEWSARKKGFVGAYPRDAFAFFGSVRRWYNLPRLRLNERPFGETIVVDIHGPVERESGDAAQLVVTLRRLVTMGYKVVLLNVAELTAIDSVILGAIAQSHTSAIRSGSRLKLVNVTDRLKELLAITKLDRFIQIAESEKTELEG